MNTDEDIRSQLAPTPPSVPTLEPKLDDVLSRARRHRARSRLDATAVGIVVLLGLGLPLASLMGLRHPGQHAEPGAVAPDSVRITCDRTSIQIGATAVEAQSGGVHVVVENTTSQTLSFAFSSTPEGPWSATKIDPGSAELALQLPPGRASFMCIAEFEKVATGQVEVDVLDPQGLFVPFDLTCSGKPIVTSPTAAPWPRGEPTEAPDPVQFVRSVARGLLPSDVLERAGYPQAPNPMVRAVRDQEIVGVFDLSMGNAGWKASYDTCSGVDVSIPSEPTAYPRGAFEWCPEPPFPEVGQDWSDRASEAALHFVEAYAADDHAVLALSEDPSVPPDARFPIDIAPGAQPTVISTNAQGGGLVEYACGNDVNAYTVAVAVDDGTDSASLNFTVYLVFRQDGWKIWAVY
jgi:hypothetical protein